MKFRVDTADVKRAAAILLGARETLTRENERTAERVGMRSVGVIKRRFRGARNTTDTATAVRTGALRDQYDYVTRRKGDSVELDLGIIRPGVDAKVLAYARVHESDGETVIRPRRAKFLAIPLREAKTATGVARGLPRDFAETFVRRNDKGRLIIYQNRGDQVVSLFALVRSVRVKGRPALVPTGRDVTMPGLREGVEANWQTLMGSIGR